MPANARKLAPTVTITALVIALVAAVALPAVYFAVGYQYLGAALQTEAQIIGRLISKSINANPELWELDTLRMEEILRRRPGDRTPEWRQVKNLKGSVLAESKDELSPPFLSRRQTVLAAGRAVGHVEITRSLRPLLLHTAVAAGAGFMFGVVILVVLKMLPRGALRRALEELAEPDQLMLALRCENSFFKTVMDNTATAILVADRSGRLMLSNPGASMLTQFDASELKEMNLSQLFGDHAWASLQADLSAVLSGTVARVDTEIAFHRKAGEERTASLSIAPLMQHQDIIGIVAAADDISERKRAEALIRSEKEVFELIARGRSLDEVLASLALAVEQSHADVHCMVLTLSDKAGLACAAAPTLEPGLVRQLNEWLEGAEEWHHAVNDLRPQVIENVQSAKELSGLCPGMLQLNLHALWLIPVVSSEGRGMGAFVIFHREPRAPREAEKAVLQRAMHLARIAMERRQAEARLEKLAHYDELTGLPNRALCRDRLSTALLRAKRNNHLVAVLLLDLSDFKLINDTLGHDQGDELLRVIAQRLGKCLRRSDTLARWGGDEFVVIAEQIPRPEYAGTIAEKLIAAVSKPVAFGSQEVYLNACIGITVSPNDGAEAEGLLRNAEAANSKARELRGNRYEFYTAGINSRAVDRLLTLNSLRRALEQKHFLLHFQPQVDLRSGEILAAEALLRWQHPERGLVPPLEFIGVLEESGLIGAVGQWVLETAVLHAKDWQSRGLRPIRVAVNLSPRQFHANLPQIVRAALEKADLDPQYLELEITESVFMSNPEGAIRTLQELRSMGVHLSLDDFGTGYSSLGYLKRFPLSTLKIDRSFVRDLPGDQEDVAIVQAILAMAQALGLSVVAEGVETMAQAEFLRGLGCDVMQGYLFSRPVLPTDIMHYLSEEKRLPMQPPTVGVRAV